MSYKRFFLVFLVSFASLSGKGQWSTVFDDKDFYLAGLYFFNEDTGFIAGLYIPDYRGAILKTTDGGMTWDTVHWGEYGSYMPRVMDFINTDTGFATGQDGILWRTFNGGESWMQYGFSFMPMDQRDLVFLDKDHGFVQTGYTTDGGETWTQYEFGWLWDFAKFGEDTLLAAGDHGIFRTYDKGNTWDTLVYQEDPGFRSISMTDELTGFCIDYHSNIFKTLDGGNTWSLQCPASWFEINHILFPAEATGYALLNERVLRTEDQGNTWTPVLFGDDKIWGFQFLDEQTGYAATADGKLFKTLNGGGPVHPPNLIDENWITTFHSPSSGNLFDSDVSGQGEIFFTCDIKDTLFYGDTLYIPPEPFASHNNLLVKMDKHGQTEWVRYLDGMGHNHLPVRVNKITNETIVLQTDEEGDVSITAINESGIPAWQESIVGLNASFIHTNDLYVHENGEIFFAGMFLGIISYQEEEIQSQTYSLFILRIRPDGTLIALQPVAECKMLPRLTVDQDLNVYVSSDILGPLVVNGDTLITGPTKKGNLIKFDSSLVFQWNYNMELAGTKTTFLELETGPGNDLYAIGTLWDENYSGLVTRFSAEGEPVFTEILGPYAEASSLDINSAGHLLLTGNFWATLKVGNDSILSYGNIDQFVLEMDEDGNQVDLFQTWNVDWYDRGLVSTYGSGFLIGGLYEEVIQFMNQSATGDYPWNIFFASSGELPSGLDRLPEPSTFRVFPNPSQGFFQISLKEKQSHPSRITVHSMQGVEVLSFSQSEENILIDLSGEPPGVYLVTLDTNGRQESCKVVIH